MLVFGLALCVLGASVGVTQIETNSIAAPWDSGSQDCKAHSHPSIEARAYDEKTYVFREGLCATFEAPFIYLLIGTDRALLIDTGDVADPDKMPLADRVFAALHAAGADTLPLLVVHTHRHLDHRAGDPQFAGRPNVQVAPYDLVGVQRFYHFTNWPEGRAHLELGGRAVDVIPAPGHEDTELAFYDNKTTLLFTGDFLLPGRLLIDDASAARASAHRVADFVRDKPVAAILGGHIEMDRTGHMFDFGSTYHPDERALPMAKADLLALPAALDSFNGLYSHVGPFEMQNSIRILVLVATGVVVVLVALIVVIVRAVRRRRKRTA
jgi:glyoxylase-like metal-dependent hydrolase (beta-lactamase superfamily II)